MRFSLEVLLEVTKSIKSLLTTAIKKRQLDLTYDYEFKEAIKEDGTYLHDWLSSKTNLITEVAKGLEMFAEVQ